MGNGGHEYRLFYGLRETTPTSPSPSSTTTTTTTTTVIDDNSSLPSLWEHATTWLLADKLNVDQAAVEQRVDEYLFVPTQTATSDFDHDAFNLKLRGGRKFELKVRLARDSRGVERWAKVVRQRVAGVCGASEVAALVGKVARQHEEIVPLVLALERMGKEEEEELVRVKVGKKRVQGACGGVALEQTELDVQVDGRQWTARTIAFEGDTSQVDHEAVVKVLGEDVLVGGYSEFCRHVLRQP